MIITNYMDGCHCDRGNPRCSCGCGSKILVNLNIKHAKGLDDPKRQAEDCEAGEQDEPGIATIRSCCWSHSCPQPRSVSPDWRVHVDLQLSDVWRKTHKYHFTLYFSHEFAMKFVILLQIKVNLRTSVSKL